MSPHQIHLWRMGLFGFISAIPLAFLIPIMTFWLTDSGCSPMHIGRMAWMMIPYALKIFLGPLIQVTSFGSLGERYGPYRLWILLAQGGVIGCIIALSFLNPLKHWVMTLSVCFVMALCGALQDCALEGYRVHTTPEDRQSAVAGSNATGYRIGLWTTTCMAMLLAQYHWPFAFLSIGGLLLLFGIIALWGLPQPSRWKKDFSLGNYFLLLQQGWHFFHRRYYIFQVLAMMGAYKLGDIFLRSMWSHYLIKAGYNKQEIFAVDKGLGIIATILGIRLGVFLIKHRGIAYGFRLWSLLQGLMALLFVFHAQYGGKNFELFFASVTLNHWVGGIGNITIVTYFSNLSKARDQRDTLHYAMLSSLGSLERTMVSWGACFVAEFVPWPTFFWIASLMCLPALVLACTKGPFKKREMGE